MKKEKYMTFERFDSVHRYSYKEDRLKIANDLGFEFISEATVKLYKRYGSSRAVGKLIGLTGGGVIHELRELKRVGLLDKIKKRGGNHPRRPRRKEDSCTN